MIILGIDPGLATTGFGVVCPIKTGASKLKCVGYGTIDTAPDMILPERLKKIHNDLGRVITQYQPKALVMENVFFFKNAKTIFCVRFARPKELFCSPRPKRACRFTATPPSKSK